MKAVRANTSSFGLSVALEPERIAGLMHGVNKRDRRGLCELPGFVIPSRLLPDTNPAEQLGWVVGRLGRYAAKGEAQQVITPPGGEPLHVDPSDTLAPGAAWRLRQIDPTYPGRVAVELGIALGEEVSPGATIELVSTRSDMTILLYRRVIDAGDVTLFDPGAPYGFTDVQDSPEPIPSWVVDIGPRW